jgi:hypothetical protein
MPDHWFSPPVRVAFGRVGQSVFVTSAEKAAELLLDKRWPRPDGRKQLAARKACLAVLDGLKEARHARKAFEAAAKEADVLLPPLNT